MINRLKFKVLLSMLVLGILFVLSACGKSETMTEEKSDKVSDSELIKNDDESKTSDDKQTDTEKNTDNEKKIEPTKEIDESKFFFSNLETQVIYDENNVKITLEVAPDREDRTYYVTAVNGLDKEISVKLGPIFVDGITIRMGLLNVNETGVQYLPAGATGVSEISLVNTQDSFLSNHYKDSGLGNIGDFDLKIVINDDMSNILFEPKTVTVKTDRGPIKPDISLITKNILIDREGIKLYLINAVDYYEENHFFVYYYENSHDKDVDLESIGYKADGVEFEELKGTMFFTMPAKSKGFYEGSVKGYKKIGVTDPKNFEITFKFTDYEDLSFETDFINFNLDKFPAEKYR